MPQTLAEEILSYDYPGPYVEVAVYVLHDEGEAPDALIAAAEGGHEGAHAALTGE